MQQDELADLDSGEDGADAVAQDYDDGDVAGDVVVDADVRTGEMAGLQSMLPTARRTASPPLIQPALENIAEEPP